MTSRGRRYISPGHRRLQEVSNVIAVLLLVGYGAVDRFDQLLLMFDFLALRRAPRAGIFPRCRAYRRLPARESRPEGLGNRRKSEDAVRWVWKPGPVTTRHPAKGHALDWRRERRI